MDAGGTRVHARLDLADGGPGWTLTWSNAGHPPPLPCTPDGRVTTLVEHDVLLHRISSEPADPAPGDDVVVLALRVP
ncbi:hypothetical protein ACIQNK_14515 [Streptomyces sp. NPDC091273]|uniref:hypothetical protein n=1 Tax=Streptomyces sp. NPDC091273 TaxID=3365982 RepID=UPI00382F8672